MRPIRFRGVTSKGKIVFGYPFQYRGQKTWRILDEHAEQWKIKPESLAQLVGYDKNGKEVYEGDTLIDELGKEFKVVWEPSFCKTSILKEQSS